MQASGSRADFWRKLSTLLAHGLPMIEALQLIAKESKSNKERAYVAKILAGLKAGRGLSEVAGAADELTVGLLMAGECSGDMSAAIARLADELEGRARLKGELMGAMLYPGIVLLLCIGLSAVLTTVVLPRFERLFVSLGVGASLPPLTAGLMAWGGWMRMWGGWVVLLVVVVWLAVKYTVPIQQRTRWGWSLPLVGAIGQQAHRTMWLRSMAVLLRAGLPLDEAMRVLGRVMVDSPLGQVSREGYVRVKDGDRLSAVLRAGGYWPEAMLQMIALGEQSGALADTVERLAAVSQESLAREIKTKLGLLEPALIIGMAGVVGLMVVALFLPLGPLVGRLSGGG